MSDLDPSDDGTITIPVPPPPANPADSIFTKEDVERLLGKARQEEKDKVYGRLSKYEETLKQTQTELEALRKAKEAEEAERLAKEADKAAAAKAKFEEDASAKDLLKAQQKEYEAKFAALEQAREQDRTLLEKEREFSALREFTQKRIAEERDSIAPELLVYVSGNTEAEVERSIDLAKQQSQALASSFQEAQQRARASLRGVAPTGLTPSGPLDTDSAHKSFSPDELKNMSMADYAKYRDSLLGTARTAQRNRGLYG
jgi:DNA repair exonuclease SbcCD ATPase subunit